MVDVELMLPRETFFGAYPKLVEGAKRLILFQAMHGPSEPGANFKWQSAFRWFMRYIHTLCPLLAVAELWVGGHRLASWSAEVVAVLCFSIAYLSWNFSIWWLTKVPPYPLQKRIWEKRRRYVVCLYGLLVGFLVALLGYTRVLRYELPRMDQCKAILGGLPGVCPALLSLPIVFIVWSSTGLFPGKVAIGKMQGIDPEVVKRGWAASGRSWEQG